MRSIVPVIMSGGSGTRLWPASTREKPKQFHSFGSELSLLQESALRTLRAEGLRVESPVVICNTVHADLVIEQLAAVGLQPSVVVTEPVARNTAAVAAVAAEAVRRTRPGSLVLLMPADHVVDDPAAFWAAVERGVAVAEDHIVTFGIRPHGPETGYGYIKRSEQLAAGAYRVERFLEKPDLETAEAYLASGEYDWNAGIFLFSPEVLAAELDRYAPAVLDAVRRTLDVTPTDMTVWALAEESFALCPSISVDYAVMEHTAHAAVVPCDIGWADLGSWSEIWRHGAETDAQTVVRGPAVALDTQASLIWSEGLPVAVIGLDDVIVVATEAGVLVAAKSRAQDVKAALDLLGKQAAAGADARARAAVATDAAGPAKLPAGADVG